VFIEANLVGLRRVNALQADPVARDRDRVSVSDARDATNLPGLRLRIHQSGEKKADGQPSDQTRMGNYLRFFGGTASTQIAYGLPHSDWRAALTQSDKKTRQIIRLHVVPSFSSPFF
jgi:hypothetical protein